MMQPIMESGSYVTCPKGHNINVIWSDQLQRFGFTCDICLENSLRAVSEHGVIEITIVDAPPNFGEPEL